MTTSTEAEEAHIMTTTETTTRARKLAASLRENVPTTTEDRARALLFAFHHLPRLYEWAEETEEAIPTEEARAAANDLARIPEWWDATMTHPHSVDIGGALGSTREIAATMRRAAREIEEAADRIEAEATAAEIEAEIEWAEEIRADERAEIERNREEIEAEIEAREIEEPETIGEPIIRDTITGLPISIEAREIEEPETIGEARARLSAEWIEARRAQRSAATIEAETFRAAVSIGEARRDRDIGLNRAKSSAARIASAAGAMLLVSDRLYHSGKIGPTTAAQYRAHSRADSITSRGREILAAMGREPESRGIARIRALGNAIAAAGEEIERHVIDATRATTETTAARQVRAREIERLAEGVIGWADRLGEAVREEIERRDTKPLATITGPAGI